MVRLLFVTQATGQSLLRLTVARGQEPVFEGEGSWLDFSYTPHSSRWQRPVSYQEDPEEWARSLPEAYAGSAYTVQVEYDDGAALSPSVSSFHGLEDSLAATQSSNYDLAASSQKNIYGLSYALFWAPFWSACTYVAVGTAVQMLVTFIISAGPNASGLSNVSSLIFIPILIFGVVLLVRLFLRVQRNTGRTDLAVFALPLAIIYGLVLGCVVGLLMLVLFFPDLLRLFLEIASL